MPEVSVPGTGATVAQHPREELGNGATITQENGQEQSGAEALNNVQQRANGAAGKARMQAFPTIGACRRTSISTVYAEGESLAEELDDALDGQPIPENREDAKAKKSGMMDKLREYKVCMFKGFRLSSVVLVYNLPAG